MPDVKPVLEAVPDPVPGVPELTAKEKRALREEARREFKASEKARIAATSTAGKKAAPAEGAAPAAAAEPEYSDAQLREATAHFLRGVLFPLLSVLVLPFGYRLDLAALSDAHARDDAAAWLPMLRLYGWLRAVVTWTAVPARLVARVRELARKREKKAPPEKETAA